MKSRRAVLWVLHWYQAWSGRRPPVCRFTPSCSEYAATAIEHYGVVRGTGLALRRVGRCRPGGGFGPDPVVLPGEAR